MHDWWRKPQGDTLKSKEKGIMMARKRSKTPKLQDNVDQGLVIVIIIGLLAGWLITAVKQNAEIEYLQNRIGTFETENQSLREQVTELQVNSIPE